MICAEEKCTGCGMCADVCEVNAIALEKGKHGFVFPQIDTTKCLNCDLCTKRCPSNQEKIKKTDPVRVYASWVRESRVRKESTSGGVFSVVAEQFVMCGGYVAGVVWNKSFHPKHILSHSLKDLILMRGSKYSQSETSGIFRQIRYQLQKGCKVLFSGTPCQVDAIRKYTGDDSNLYTIDVVCHGVPSNEMLDRYYMGFNETITNVLLRKKDPYWDYSYVCLDFASGKKYRALTIEDPFFNLFNTGYSLRPSCHDCRFASIKRCSDITLADFWGYRPHSYRTRNYNKGTSLVLINTEKGKELFESVNSKVFFETADIELAKKWNKCLTESFKIEAESLESFWRDYEAGMSIFELDKKYSAGSFRLPPLIVLRRLYKKWKWIIGK